METQKEINKDEYNGFQNRETWAVNLHLTNDENLYNEVRDLLKQKYEYKFQKDDALKDYVEELFYNLKENEFSPKQKELIFNMMSDVGSLWRVNWTEIVKAFLED